MINAEFQMFSSKNQFLLSFVSFPVAKRERTYFWNMVVIAEQLAAGVRTDERSSSVVMHFLALGCISAGQCQRDVLDFSLGSECPPGSGVMLPQPSPAQSSPKSIPSLQCPLTHQLLTCYSQFLTGSIIGSLNWCSLKDYCDHSQVVAKEASVTTGRALELNLPAAAVWVCSQTWKTSAVTRVRSLAPSPNCFKTLDILLFLSKNSVSLSFV